jgi:hypothetical protein
MKNQRFEKQEQPQGLQSYTEARKIKKDVYHDLPIFFNTSRNPCSSYSAFVIQNSDLRLSKNKNERKNGIKR